MQIFQRKDYKCDDEYDEVGKVQIKSYRLGNFSMISMSESRMSSGDFTVDLKKKSVSGQVQHDDVGPTFSEESSAETITGWN